MMAIAVDSKAIKCKNDLSKENTVLDKLAQQNSLVYVVAPRLYQTFS